MGGSIAQPIIHDIYLDNSNLIKNMPWAKKSLIKFKKLPMEWRSSKLIIRLGVN